ncbi:uncharacterized protein Z520_09842 [Fonsecaea multimorphosa CBS 102226]|uniref:Uncharacterized protein n=1 Tax=Fonsecaea multimorphosa CBS 102226 TaxID=1442371 RepID=A0A0D2IBE1_9EURO|nr:uncharacterized protein Z520_09842 [Fonsecaea multimorphosa CBS 102226]KIX94456.1 hypothetical protein Z520_09842 [Fonsecaea multimorphosa CBS 102226]OAL20036.1 hypothetical protein AYO22_09186 [Fonsecaea multimorphosa]
MANAHAHPIPPAIPHDLFTQEVPPSPTLTNPDMILPYQPHLNSSPSPRASSPILHSSPISVRPDSAVSLGSSPAELEPGVELGIATTIRMPSRAVPPINTNYYGYEHGAPLSDIGEEETPKSKKSRRTESPLRSGPPSPSPAGPITLAARRLSNQSCSSNGSDLGSWEDFDTSKIMNERLAADVAKVPDEDIEEADSKRNSMITTNAEDEMALLNERAERILEHARKRLTHMEDNLSKARHSILLSSRSSPNINEFHQPAGGLYRSISLAGASQRKPRPLHLVNRNNSVAHARGGSDTTGGNSGLKRLSIIPEIRSASALEYGRRQESPQQLLHSPSARGGPHSPASNRSFNSPLRVLKEEESPPSTTKTTPDASAPRGLGINTLAAVSKEDISVVTSSPPTALARSSSAMSNRSTKEIREQMSNLQAKISDLKDKAQADSLRRKSMQSIRTPSPFASAQSPEQWYTSAPEYKEAGSPINTNAGMGWSPPRQKMPLDLHAAPVTPQAQTLLNVELPATKDSFVSEARTDKNTPSLHKSIHLQPAPLEKPNSLVQESLYEDAAQEFDDDEPIAASEEEQIYLNEVLEESLQDLEPDVPEIPEHLLTTEGAAERHEDRLDAFDYENMFLHSALGNYTGTGIRSETPSESDCSSVTTTRMNQDTPTIDEDDAETQLDEEIITEEAANTPTPIQETFLKPGTPPNPTPLATPSKPWMKAARSNSVDSVSTVATFATATEGAGGGEDEVEEMPTEILTWGNGTGFSQTPMSPKRGNTAVWPTPPMSGRARQGQMRSPQQSQMQGSIVSNGIPTPPVHSPHASFPTPRAFGGATKTPKETPVDHPANTEILMESLIKLADPEFKVGEGPGSVTFSTVDKDLVLDLLRAVGGVCNEILRSERKHEMRAAKVLRRRLDESRKLLEGRADE